MTFIIIAIIIFFKNQADLWMVESSVDETEGWDEHDDAQANVQVPAKKP